MEAKLILVLCVSLFSVVFAMPQPTAEGPTAEGPKAEMEPKENMKPAETSFLSFGLGLGAPAVRYSPYTYGYRSGLGIGLGWNYPHYNSYSDYYGYHY